MLPFILTIGFWVSAALMLLGLAQRARLWRNGRAAKIELGNLLAIPKRYFVDLHHVVAREPFIARTHVAVAGGAVLAVLHIAVWLRSLRAPKVPRALRWLSWLPPITPIAGFMAGAWFLAVLWCIVAATYVVLRSQA